ALSAFVGSLVTWWVTRDRLPSTLRIATAAEGGLYAKLGRGLAVALEKSTGHPVEVLFTGGSVENVALLERGEADLAIVQDGTARLGELSRLAPLYHDICHVIVPEASPVHDVDELDGRRLVLGPVCSGTRATAVQVLEHYGISVETSDVSQSYFREFPRLLAAGRADGCVVTTGILNPDLFELLRHGGFRILPIRDATALVILHPHFHSVSIPRGLYAGRPAIPPSEIPTVAATSYLVASESAGSRLVNCTLDALYHSELRRDVPTLIAKRDAREWSTESFHPAARRYFDPFEGLDTMSSLLESLSAFKELLFALGAAGYLLWSRWRSVRARQRDRELERYRERLDDFLDQTVDIERAQMGRQSADALEGYLERVTEIKLRALEELTHEDLRSDQRFVIFLTQCSNLIRKIQGKLALVHGESRRS
ncbi:MAG: TAXI family TRAP transporter solute-binding subunit, partial [Planctomycetes bacterium]|nr:TAXI family TRAP transporter solute-binding subunit [Planctomycetota bacterium]